MPEQRVYQAFDEASERLKLTDLQGLSMILVDSIRRYPSGYWCHMVTDSSLEELHAFASRLGLLRERFQEHARLPHYDLRLEIRERALALGAEAVGSKELFRRGREAFLREQKMSEALR